MKTSIARSVGLTLLLTVIVLFLGVRSFGAARQAREAERLVRDAQARLDALARSDEEAKQDVRSAADEQWLERQARLHLNVQAPGETVIYVYKDEKTGTLAPAEPSSAPEEQPWRVWWRFFTEK